MHSKHSRYTFPSLPFTGVFAPVADGLAPSTRVSVPGVGTRDPDGPGT